MINFDSNTHQPVAFTVGLLTITTFCLDSGVDTSTIP